jgi:hypothetical protein
MQLRGFTDIAFAKKAMKNKTKDIENLSGQKVRKNFCCNIRDLNEQNLKHGTGFERKKYRFCTV